MFTWAQADYCVNKDEFDVSVGLFFHLLRQNETKAILGDNAHDLIREFYLESVHPHLDHMCFYLRKHLYHMDQHTFGNTAFLKSKNRSTLLLILKNHGRKKT